MLTRVCRMFACVHGTFTRARETRIGENPAKSPAVEK
jgi:hypothetical protein